MKIGVISDTHIPIQAKEIPANVLQSLKGIDMLIHAGDLVKLSVLETLKSICPNLKAVRGNMDASEVINTLPEKEIINAGKYRIGLTHGHGSPASLINTVSKMFENDKVDIIIFGHSHFPVNEKRGKVLYFNPGSLTDTIFAPFNSYGFIEINDEIKAKIIRI
ncbi:MAG: metallophosphoesterase family protein [Candidatus Omnitrophota bacterium]